MRRNSIVGSGNPFTIFQQEVASSGGALFAAVESAPVRSGMLVTPASVLIRERRAICAAVLAVAWCTSGCSSPNRTPAPPPASALWGELKPVVSVKELMRDMLDPASDNIFEAVKIVSTAEGTAETMPRTEQDWAKIRMGAVTLAEGVYLLKIPRPFAPDGDVNNSTGPEPTELSPTQIKVKLEADPVLWNAKIEALRNVGLEVLEIVKKKNVAELWDAGANLDNACESCHVQYWYPGDAAVLQRLDRLFQQRFEQSRREKASRGR